MFTPLVWVGRAVGAKSEGPDTCCIVYFACQKVGGAIRLTTRGQSEAQDRLECASRACRHVSWGPVLQLLFMGGVVMGAHLSSTLSGSAGHTPGVSPGEAFLGGMLILFGSRLAAGCTRYEWVHKVQLGAQGMSGCTRYEWVCKVQVGARGMSGCTRTSGCTRYEWVYKVRVWAAEKETCFAAAAAAVVVVHFFARVLYGRLK